MGPFPVDSAELLVKDIINPTTRNWDLDRIRQFLPQHEVEIRSIKLNRSVTKDELRWLPMKNGIYTTKSGYATVKKQRPKQTEEEFNWSRDLWHLKTSPKLKMFIWKSMNNALSVGTAIASRGI